MFSVKRVLVLSFLVVTVFFSHSSLAQIYKWVDENGKTHFSDRKQDTSTIEEVEVKTQKSDWQTFDIKIRDDSGVLTPEEKSQIVTDVNNVYWFFDRVLFFDMYKTVPIHMTIFPDFKGYSEYLYSKVGNYGTGSIGMFLPKTNEIVAFKYKDNQKLLGTIKHEVSHAVTHTVTPYSPAWLNEGIAELMETMVSEGDHVRIYKRGRNHRWLLDLLKQDKLLSVSEFLGLRSDQWREPSLQAENPNYQQSREICFYLMSTVAGKNFLVRLFHNFERGDRTISKYLIDDMYTGGIKTLNLQWRNWLQKSANVKPLEFNKKET